VKETWTFILLDHLISIQVLSYLIIHWLCDSLIWWLEAVRDAVILVDVDINEIYSVIEAKGDHKLFP
jgi:hypothetical protein